MAAAPMLQLPREPASLPAEPPGWDAEEDQALSRIDSAEDFVRLCAELAARPIPRRSR